LRINYPITTRGICNVMVAPARHAPCMQLVLAISSRSLLNLGKHKNLTFFLYFCIYECIYI